MTTPADDLLTTAEVAALLRLAQGTLRYWRAIDKGPKSFRIGSTVVYERAEIAAYLERQRAETTRGDS